MIGQAKGILMERFSVDADRAFEMLIISSRTVKLLIKPAAPGRAGVEHSGRTWLTTTDTGDGTLPTCAASFSPASTPTGRSFPP